MGAVVARPPRPINIWNFGVPTFVTLSLRSLSVTGGQPPDLSLSLIKKYFKQIFWYLGLNTWYLGQIQLYIGKIV